MEHWHFWVFSFWFDIETVRDKNFAIEGGFMIVDIPYVGVTSEEDLVNDTKDELQLTLLLAS